MKKSKYAYFDYWVKQVEEDVELWEGLFQNKPISEESLIISPVIINSHSKHHENSFVVYPNVKSVIGFLMFTYLPTAYISLFFHESDDLILESDLEEFFSDQKASYPDKLDLINHMESFYDDLQVLFDSDDDAATEGLLKWMDRFNEDWLGEEYIILSLNIFTSPKELAEELIRVYEEDLDIKMLEEDLELTVEEFRQLASDEIYTNDFMKRKFTDILTNKLFIAL